MKFTSQMENLNEEIINSFKNRVQKNGELVDEVQKTLDGFRKGHQEMIVVLNNNAKALKEGIASGEKERLNTYNDLITDIHQSVTSIKNAAGNLLTGFNAERAQMAAGLQEFFIKSNAGRLQDEENRSSEFEVFIKNINDEISSIFKNTGETLEKFHSEHLEMSAEMKTDLSKNLAERVAITRSLINGFQVRLGEIRSENQVMAQALRNKLVKNEEERLTGYDNLMKEILAKVSEIRDHSAHLVNDFAQDRKGAAASWNSMASTLNQLRKKEAVPIGK